MFLSPEAKILRTGAPPVFPKIKEAGPMIGPRKRVVLPQRSNAWIRDRSPTTNIRPL
jgi:hypothetical protein